MRKRRLDLGLLRREVAERLSADTCSVTNWELNRTQAGLKFLPGIVRFLGYAPWPADGSTGERLLGYRRERGLSQSALAQLIGVDPGTLSRWERGYRVPPRKYARLPEAFLARVAPEPGSDPPAAPADSKGLLCRPLDPAPRSALGES